MFSIWFYFMPNGTALETVGYKDKDAAYKAILEDSFFQDEVGNDIIIHAELKKTAVIKICETV